MTTIYQQTSSGEKLYRGHSSVCIRILLPDRISAAEFANWMLLLIGTITSAATHRRWTLPRPHNIFPTLL